MTIKNHDSFCENRNYINVINFYELTWGSLMPRLIKSKSSCNFVLANSLLKKNLCLFAQENLFVTIFKMRYDVFKLFWRADYRTYLEGTKKSSVFDLPSLNFLTSLSFSSNHETYKFYNLGFNGCTFFGLDFADLFFGELGILRKFLTVFVFQSSQLLVSLKTTNSLLTVLTLCKFSMFGKFTLLTDLGAAEHFYKIGLDSRFSVSYNLLSLQTGIRLHIRCFIDKFRLFLPTIHSLFENAKGFEREVGDMFGIVFFGNMDLRRILTDYGFGGHPLRKSFPLPGFVELRYNDALHRIVFEPLELAQDLRFFEFTNPGNIENVSELSKASFDSLNYNSFLDATDSTSLFFSTKSFFSSSRLTLVNLNSKPALVFPSGVGDNGKRVFFSKNAFFYKSVPFVFCVCNENNTTGVGGSGELRLFLQYSEMDFFLYVCWVLDCYLRAAKLAFCVSINCDLNKVVGGVGPDKFDELLLIACA